MMKTLKFSVALCAVALLFTSCNDERKDAAKKNVDSFENYVDSISNLELAEAHANWNNIEKEFNNRKSNAVNNLNGIEESEALKKDIDDATHKFGEFKVELAEKRHQDMIIKKENFRMSLLGNNYVQDDMKFGWINKNNILSVYQNFVDTVDANKDNYSREDWDEIKLLYEAIDTRKNTVEKEGLSSTDNRKIAGLKLKFAPTYTLNRMGAKSEENAAAKQ